MIVTESTTTIRRFQAETTFLSVIRGLFRAVRRPSCITGNVAAVNVVLTALFFLCAIAQHAFAANITKADNATDLDQTGSWVGAVVPTSADIVLWNSTVTASRAVKAGSNQSWLGLVYSNPGSAATFNATAGNKKLTLGSSGLDMSGATVDLTLDCDIVLGSNQTWTVASGRTLTISATNSTITNGGSGATSLSKDGLGTIINNASVSYTGVTTISGGTFTVATLANGGTNSGLGAATNAASNLVFDGGTLRYTGAVKTIDRSFTLTLAGAAIDGSGSGALTLTGGPSLVYTGSGARTLTLTGSATGNTFGYILADNSGATALVKSGTGSWILTGANTYTEATTINAGTLQCGAASVIPSSSQVSIANAGSTIVNLNGFSQSIGSLTGGGATGGNVNLGAATLTVGQDNTSPAAYSGQIYGAGGLTKTGTGTLTLNSANASYNTFSGAVTITGGVISAAYLANGGSNSDIGAATNAAANIVFNGGALRYFGSGASINRSFTINTTGGSIDASGSGALTLSGGPALAYGGSGTRTFTLAGSNTGSNTFGYVLADNGGATSLSKSGDGKWILSGANTYTGATTVNAGTLAAGAVTSAFGSNSAVTIANASGAVLDITGFSNSIGSLTGGGGAGGSIVLGAATLIVGGDNTSPASYAGLISGTGSLTKTGSGTLTLASPSPYSSYSGVTTINGGAISLAIVANGGSNSDIGASAVSAANLVISSGTLKYSGNGASSDRLFTVGTGTTGATIDASGTGALNLTGTGIMGFSGTSTRTLTLTGSNTGDNTLAAVINNDGSGNATSLIKSGTGTWVVSGASNYTGVTTISGGTLKVGSLADGGSASNIGASTNATTNLVLNGGTITYTGIAANSNRLFTIGTGANGGTINASGSGGLNLTNTGIMGLSGSGTRTLTLTGTNTGDNILAATVTDEGANATSLTKSGTGTWVVSGTNSFTGAATVSSGILGLTSSLSGPLTVQNGGACRLGGAGTTATINSGNLNIQSGATAFLDINGTTAGVDYDQLNVTGSVTLGGDLVITLNATPTVGNTYTIIVNDGADAVSGSFFGSGEGGSVTASYLSTSYEFTISYIGGTGNDVVLTCSQLPKTWTGSSSTVWGAAGNWSGGVPGSGDIASFDAASYANQPSLGATGNAKQISMSSGSAAVTIGGGSALTIGVNGISMNSATNTLTINAPVILGASQTWNAATTLTLSGSTITNGTYTLTASGTGAITMSDVIGSGSGGINKNGAGTLTLSGANTFTGAVSLSAGVLTIQNATATGTTAGGVTVSTGAALQVQGGIAVGAEALQLSGSGISLGGALLNVSGANSWGGTITLNAASAIKCDAGTLTLSGAVSNGTYLLTIDGAGNITINGAVGGGSGGITKNGSGTLTLNGTNTLTGTTTVASGTLAGSGSLAGALTVSYGATLSPGASGAAQFTSGTFTLASGATYAVDLNGATAGTQYDQLVVSSGGTVTLGGTLSLTLGYTPSFGTTFTIIDNQGASAVTNTFSGLAEGGTITSGSYTFQITYSGGTGNDVVLTCIAPLRNWTGSSSTAWSTAGNWNGGVPSGSERANFNSSSYTNQPNLDATGIAVGIVVGSSSGSVTVGGANILTLGMNGIDMASAGSNLTISAPITLGAAQTWSVANSRTITTSGAIVNGGYRLTLSSTGTTTINGAISGSGGLLKSGLGGLTLAGANTLTGDVTISAGILNLTGSLTNALTVESGATYSVKGNGATGIVNCGAMDLRSGSTFSVEIDGTAAGTNYDQANVTGSVTLGAYLTLTLGYAPATSSTYTIIANDGADAVSGAFFSNVAVENGTITAAYGGETYAFSISYVGGTGNDVVLTCLGTTLVWIGAAGNPSPTNWSKTQNWAGGVAPSGSGSIIVYNAYSAGQQTTGTNDIAGLTISIVVSNIPAACGIASGSQPFTLNAGGVDMGSASQNFSIAQAFSFGAAQSYFIASGKTLTFSNSVTENNHPLTVTGAGNFVLSGVLGAGTGTITMNGSGAMTLSGANAFSGGVTLASGTLNINNASAFGTGTFTISGTGTINNSTAGAITITNPMAWNSSFSFTGTQALTMNTGAVTMGANPTITVNASTLTIGGPIGETGGARTITKAGAGTLTLNGTNTFTGAITVNAGVLVLGGANSYSGTTTISGGTLRLGANDVIPNGSGKGDVSLTGTFDLNSFSDIINGLSGAGTITGTGALTIGGNDATSTFPGVVNNSGTTVITKTGAGTLTLSGTNTHTGITTVSGGTLKLGSTAALGGTGGKTVVNSGYTLDLNGLTYSTAEPLDLSGTGIGTNGALVNSSATAAVYNGPITLIASSSIGGTGNISLSNLISDGASSFSLTKAGADTLTLSYATGNTYDGGTTVSAGKLLVTNTSGSATGTGAVAVNGGSLAGTGVISGAVTIANGAIIQPGNAGAATLTLSGGLILNNASMLDYDVGTTSDQIAITGNLTLDGTINITAVTGFGAGAITILTYTGTLTNNTLVIGTKPAGNYSYTIDVSTANQIKLIIGTSKWSQSSLGTINSGAITESALYLSAGSPDILYSRSLADGSQKWSYATGHGVCRNPTYDFDGANYKVLASAVDWVIGQQDNGTTSADLWSPAAINLPGAGTPYISPSGASFYVPYTGNLTKRNIAAPASSPLTIAVGDISTVADIVVASDYVYVATTGGCINRYDAGDLTNLTTYGPMGGAPGILQPLLMANRVLYVMPDNDSLIAISTSTMGRKWGHKYSQSAGKNSGAAFIEKWSNSLYTVAGSYVYKIADNGGSAGETWFYNALSTVNSGPIPYGGTVYFGRSTGNYYAIKDADGSTRAGWPRTLGSGNASAGPWVDVSNDQVIFGTTGGNLDAFDLEQ
jgi:fibronectin-binding autotransporter adhesin